MGNKNNTSKKSLALKILLSLVCTISGVCLLMSGLEENSKPYIIIASFILLLDLIMIIASILDGVRKR